MKAHREFEESSATRRKLIPAWKMKERLLTPQDGRLEIWARVEAPKAPTARMTALFIVTIGIEGVNVEECWGREGRMFVYVDGRGWCMLKRDEKVESEEEQEFLRLGKWEARGGKKLKIRLGEPCFLEA
jgi:hypothetical protein